MTEKIGEFCFHNIGGNRKNKNKSKILLTDVTPNLKCAKYDFFLSTGTKIVSLTLHFSSRTIQYPIFRVRRTIIASISVMTCIEKM